MSAPPLPPTFEQLGNRPFSFYPAIVNVEHNEWTLRKTTWSEVAVANTKTGEELWISRRFLGEVSRTDEPVCIVGLKTEVQYVAGQVVPHVRRVIEIPKAGAAAAPQRQTQAVKVPSPLRTGADSTGAERTAGKLLLWVLGGGVLLSGLALLILNRQANPPVEFRPVLQSELGLNAEDDYSSIVRKLGTPASDQWRSEKGEMQYRVLSYPARNVSVVLMGIEREKAVYIGAVDPQWRPVHAVALRGGKDTYSMLRALKPGTP